MDFASNNLLVCTLHAINVGVAARDDDEKSLFATPWGFESWKKKDG
jgi:hypothetical protein